MDDQLFSARIMSWTFPTTSTGGTMVTDYTPTNLQKKPRSDTGSVSQHIQQEEMCPTKDRRQDYLWSCRHFSFARKRILLENVESTTEAEHWQVWEFFSCFHLHSGEISRTVLIFLRRNNSSQLTIWHIVISVGSQVWRAQSQISNDSMISRERCDLKELGAWIVTFGPTIPLCCVNYLSYLSQKVQKSPWTATQQLLLKT